MSDYSYIDMIRTPGTMKDKHSCEKGNKACEAAYHMGNTFKYFDLILHGGSNVSKQGCEGTIKECGGKVDEKLDKIRKKATQSVSKIMVGREELGDQYIKKDVGVCSDKSKLDLFVNNRPGNMTNSMFAYKKSRGGRKKGRGLIPGIVEQIVKINPIDALIDLSSTAPKCQKYCVKEIKTSETKNDKDETIKKVGEKYTTANLSIEQADKMSLGNFKDFKRESRECFSNMNQAINSTNHILKIQQISVGLLSFYIFYKLMKNK